MGTQILSIDDDPAIQDAIRIATHELGFQLSTVNDGPSGLAAGMAGTFDVVILDLGLPGLGGMEVCKKLRAARPTLPIVILSSRSDEVSTVLSLELGADDYIRKPFSVHELVARLKAVIRRAKRSELGATEHETNSVVVVGDLRIDVRRREATKRGAPLELSKTEFELLAYFVSKLGQPISREELMENVWGYQCTGFDSSVTTALNRLRQRVEDVPSKPIYFRTVRGIGYRFVDPTNDGPAD